MRVKIATFNVRCGVAEDGANHWRFRREFAGELLRGLGADVIGLQECYGFQKDDLTPLLPGYAWAGLGREDGVAKGEMCAVLWREERWEARGVGHFWLSDKPEVAGSMAWGTACCRMATWVRLREKGSGREFVVLNTHMDHVSEEAREKGAKLIGERMRGLVGDGLGMIVGDFNCEEGSPPYAALRQAGWVDTWREVNPRGTVAEGTFHSFKGHTSGERIDWILRSKGWKTARVGMEAEGRGGKWASDHHLVWGEVEG